MKRCPVASTVLFWKLLICLFLLFVCTRRAPNWTHLLSAKYSIIRDDCSTITLQKMHLLLLAGHWLGAPSACFYFPVAFWEHHVIKCPSVLFAHTVRRRTWPLLLSSSHSFPYASLGTLHQCYSWCLQRWSCAFTTTSTSSVPGLPAFYWRLRLS